jgi:hypothetical protein
MSQPIGSIPDEPQRRLRLPSLKSAVLNLYLYHSQLIHQAQTSIIIVQPGSAPIRPRACAVNVPLAVFALCIDKGYANSGGILRATRAHVDIRAFPEAQTQFDAYEWLL